MADKKFDLGDYVEVKDRIKLFYELFGGGRLVTANYELTREPDDKPKVIVTAYAYRTTDDPHPGVGTSWMYLPGKSSFQIGSEIENTETSAWGRAIGALGILIDRSIATTNEIENKSGSAAAPAHVETPSRAEVTGILSIGTSNQSDGLLRETKTGWALGFNLTTGPRQWVRILVEDDLALKIAEAHVELRPGLPLKVYGLSERAEDAVGDRIIRYQRITADRIVADEWEFPVPGQTGPGLFDAEAERELDAIL